MSQDEKNMDYKNRILSIGVFMITTVLALLSIKLFVLMGKKNFYYAQMRNTKCLESINLLFNFCF